MCAVLSNFVNMQSQHQHTVWLRPQYYLQQFCSQFQDFFLFSICLVIIHQHSASQIQYNHLIQWSSSSPWGLPTQQYETRHSDLKKRIYNFSAHHLSCKSDPADLEQKLEFLHPRMVLACPTLSNLSLVFYVVSIRSMPWKFFFL